MNALTKEFCRERATFVENKCMSIIRSKAMILRNEMRNYTKIFFLLAFTICKAEKPLQGIALKDKDEEQDEKHIRSLFRKNPKIKGACQL